MPTTRTRRRRQTQLTPVPQRLLAGTAIEQTEENRQELITLKYFGWRDYYPNTTLGKQLERLASAELERWDDEA